MLDISQQFLIFNFEMRHPRCVGSINKEFSCLTQYSRTQLHFTQ